MTPEPREVSAGGELMAPYVVVLRTLSGGTVKLAFEALSPDAALDEAWRRADADEPATEEVQVWDFHEREMLRHGSRPASWELLKEWEELRALLRAAQVQEDEARCLLEGCQAQTATLDRKLTRLELRRPEELARIFRHIAKTYEVMGKGEAEPTEVSGPLTFDDETKLGLGDAS